MEVYAQITRIEGLLEAKKVDAARQQINELAIGFPELWYIPMFRARIALSLGDNKEAEAQALQAIAINAEDAYLHFLLSMAQHNLKKYDEALMQIELAISIDPNEPQFYALKGQQLMQRERYLDAEYVVREGLQLNPDHEGCLQVLALSLNVQGKRDFATDTVGELLASNPESPDAHANAGFLALNKNDVDAARTHFVEALRLDPDNQWAQNGLAEVIKATNPLYRQFLRFSVWMADIGEKYRWGLIIGLLVVIRFVPILVPFYIILLLWTWFTAPISSAYLLFHPQGKYLISKEDKPFVAGIFIALFLAVLVAVSGFLIEDSSYYLLAGGLALTSIPLNRIVDSDKESRTVLISLAWCVAFVGLGLWASTGDSSASSALVLTAVAYSWLGNRLG